MLRQSVTGCADMSPSNTRLAQGTEWTVGAVVQDLSWKMSPFIEKEIQDDILRWAEDNRDDDVSDEIRKVCNASYAPC